MSGEDIRIEDFEAAASYVDLFYPDILRTTELSNKEIVGYLIATTRVDQRWPLASNKSTLRQLSKIFYTIVELRGKRAARGARNATPGDAITN